MPTPLRLSGEPSINWEVITVRRLVAVLMFCVAWGVLAVSGAGAAVAPLSLVSGPSPFKPGCNKPETGTNFINAEVEPYVAANPAHAGNLIGVWQQDRWSNGGANGLLTGVSNDGGHTWTRPTPPPFARCEGGNAQNGGNYDRATDPWATIAPNGDAYQISDSLNDPDLSPTSAIVVSKSRDGGKTWGPLSTLIRDTSAQFLNDKESITADPTNSNRVFAVWDRLDQVNPNAPFFGPTWLSRTTNGGASWQTRKIYDPGANNQTIGNQIVVLPSGKLLDVFDLILQGNTFVAEISSTDHGNSWSSPVLIDSLLSNVVVDPRDGHPVRTGDVIPEVTVDPRSGAVYVVWQDTRFNSAQNDEVVLSKSADGGLSWSPAKVISENPGTQAFTPQIRVDGSGNIAVSYFDFTFDTTSSPTLATDYWIARSSDGGDSFHPRERITASSFDMRIAPDASGFFVGDYQGLTSEGAVFEPFFVRGNSGNTANRTDVFATRDQAPFPLTGVALAQQPGSRGTPSGRPPGRVSSGHPVPVTVH